MKNPSIVFLSFAHQIAAVSAVNNLPPEAQVLEFGQTHLGHTVLLAATDKNFLQTGIQDAVDGIFLESPKGELLKGYFKQLATPVRKNLLVIESPKLSQVFSTVDGLLKKTSYELIEINRAAGAAAHAVAYMANGEAEDALMPAMADLHVRLFEEPTVHLLSLFNIR